MLCAALLSSFSVQAAQQFVHFHQGDVLLNPGNRVEIYMDANDCKGVSYACLLYTSPSPRDTRRSRMPSSA